MIRTIGIYHIGIPVDDLDRAEDFYTKVLGMKVEARIGESGARLARLKCGDADVVLFQRPRPLGRNTLEEDGIAHQAFEVAPEAFDEALEFLKMRHPDAYLDAAFRRGYDRGRVHYRRLRDAKLGNRRG